MLFIHKTVSLCDHCYRHIPANVIEEDDVIKLVKRCPKHGEMKSIVEIDKEFYYGLTHNSIVEQYNQILFEASDRCQLTCPHCYHLPDNQIQDRSIEEIVRQVTSFPRYARPMLAGAEATLRPDFIELSRELKNIGYDAIDVLTNGIRFADKEFAQSAWDAGLQHACIGLNHWTYQGKKVHEKQLRAINNLLDIGYWIGYVGYTIETLDHIPDILNEIETIKHERIWQYRIRCGSFIGRSNDQQRSYLSNLVKKVKEHYGGNLESVGPDDNPYHVMLKTPTGVILRLIQWPDVTNIDMEELATGPWCNFYDGPMTNFVHQVITRDAYKNMGIEPPDRCPRRYHYNSVENLQGRHWKHHWSGPKEVTELDWTYISPPIPIIRLQLDQSNNPATRV
jgi:Radical SAM superfamily